MGHENASISEYNSKKDKTVTSWKMRSKERGKKNDQRKMRLEVQYNGRIREQKTTGGKRGEHQTHTSKSDATVTYSERGARQELSFSSRILSSFSSPVFVHAHTASAHHRFSPPRTPHSTIPAVLATYSHAPRGSKHVPAKSRCGGVPTTIPTSAPGATSAQIGRASCRE